MRLWLIKFGKALTALKNEGLFRGGARIVKSFFAMFRRVGSGDILFITGGLGDSARYRAFHTAEELRRNGFKTSVTVQDNPFLAKYADRFSVFVFHRVLWTEFVARLVRNIKEQKKTVIFDTDDLVFDAKYFKDMDYSRVMNRFERKQYEGGVGAEILADPYTEIATTTTEFLAEKLREKGKKVFIVPNKLSQEDGEICEKIYSQKPRSAFSVSQLPTLNSQLSIGYFSGSKGHDKDFAVVAPALLALLRRHENLRLFIGGPLTLGEEFSKLSERITRLPLVPRVENFKNMACVDINIAPLEIGNPFCESKSELKFFEAGAVGVPTVASATRTFCEAITDGVDGFVATTAKEWEEKLERLIADTDLRREMGERARETALEKYTTKNANNREYYEYISFKLRSCYFCKIVT